MRSDALKPCSNAGGFPPIARPSVRVSGLRPLRELLPDVLADVLTAWHGLNREARNAIRTSTSTPRGTGGLIAAAPHARARALRLVRCNPVLTPAQETGSEAPARLAEAVKRRRRCE
jgi:hypothetical protein